MKLNRSNLSLFNIILVMVLLMICFAVPAYAGPLGAVKGWFGAFSLKAVALILTGVLGIGVLATKREWIAAIFLACGNLLIGVGEFIAYGGTMLADGKIEPDEITRLRAEMTDIPTLFGQVMTVFRGRK